MDELRDPLSGEIPPTSGIDDPSELLEEGRHHAPAAGHLETDIYARLPVHDRPAARACVEAAKKDGRWEKAYAGSADMEIPEDFLTALDKLPRAKKFFATRNRQFCSRFIIGFTLPESRKHGHNAWPKFCQCW